MASRPTSLHAVISTNSYAEETSLAELADLRAALRQAGKSSNDVERIALSHLEQRTKLQKFIDSAVPHAEAYTGELEEESTFPSVTVVDGFAGEIRGLFLRARLRGTSRVRRTKARRDKRGSGC